MKRLYRVKQSRQENITYLVVWGLLFAAPLLSMYVRTVGSDAATFNWAEVFFVWRKFAVFLLLFIIHNFLLAPLLIHQHKRLMYFAFVAVLLGTFTLYQCSNRPEEKKPMEHMPSHMEQAEHRQPPFDEPSMEFDEPPMELDEPPMKFDGQPPHLDNPRRHEMRRDTPPPFVGENDILAIVVLLLMFGANLGIKGYFRGRDDKKRLEELEKQNLEQQLEYLRYQINPHFFMNTLNNIHALVDIDPAKAQMTIVELSKMMRFVLYEGDKQLVPLSRELEFIRTYISLMQLRYSDKVKITVYMPDEVPERSIPPLILISFIENAFKHGVSYQHESFIEVKISVEGDRLLFTCRNSKAATPNQEQGGVGLTNVRKRLDLLFGNDYMLQIKDAADVYTVDLVIPI